MTTAQVVETSESLSTTTVLFTRTIKLNLLLKKKKIIIILCSTVSLLNQQRFTTVNDKDN